MMGELRAFGMSYADRFLSLTVLHFPKTSPKTRCTPVGGTMAKRVELSSYILNVPPVCPIYLVSS